MCPPRHPACADGRDSAHLGGSTGALMAPIATPAVSYSTQSIRELASGAAM